MTIMREKRIHFLGMQFSIFMDVHRVERIRRSIPYRVLVRPTLNWLERLGGRDNGASPGGSTPGQAESAPNGSREEELTAGLDWYHSIELPELGVTPGYVDHRAQVPLYGLPQDMRGMRAIDVATYDGFWAFEMERRGAEVLAIDIENLAQCDYPRRYQAYAQEHASDQLTGKGFFKARELLGSKVDRKIISVYDLNPDAVGTFDFAFVSDLLLHLRDPALALERVNSVVRPGGSIIVAEPYSPELDLYTAPLSRFGYAEALGWWQHSPATLHMMLWAAGFDDIEEISRFTLDSKAAVPIEKLVLRGRQAMGDGGEISAETLPGVDQDPGADSRS